MNFPGLDPGWKGFHRLLHRAGAIRPWGLAECKAGIQNGCGVLIVANTALGDSVLCTPLVQTISACIGPERTGFLVRAAYRDLFADDTRVKNIFCVSGKFRNFCELRKNILSAPAPFRVALIANCTEPDIIPWLWWCGIRGFLRYRSRWSQLPEWFANKDMMRPPDAPDYATGHAIENNLAMASALDMKPVTHQLALVVNGFSSVEADKKIVLIHPGASRAQKQWPLEHWKQIVESSTLRDSAKIILTGNPAEQRLTDALARMTNVPTENLAGKLSLRELALLKKKAALFLSGDTGPYHMAVAVGCPTVTLFAPTDRGSSVEACGPHQADPEKHIALETQRHGDSISTIAAGKVLQAVAKILARNRP